MNLHLLIKNKSHISDNIPSGKVFCYSGSATKTKKKRKKKVDSNTKIIHGPLKDSGTTWG